MNTQEFISKSLKESSEVKLLIEKECSADIIKSIDVLVEAFKNGKKLLLCGNGGSAADSQHIAAEFMIRLSHDLNRPAIPAIALTTDTSILTAGGNDIGYDNVFARTVEGLGNEGDILLAISTSGNSGNVIKAVEKAKEQETLRVKTEQEAYDKGNASICEQIETKADMYSCKYNVISNKAIGENDPTLCENIEELSLVEACKLLF